MKIPGREPKGGKKSTYSQVEKKTTMRSPLREGGERDTGGWLWAFGKRRVRATFKV